MRTLLVSAAILASLFSCAHEISSDERLERATQKNDMKGNGSTADVVKIRCDDTNNELNKARNDSRPETDRLISYKELFDSLKTRVARFDEAMSRNPDLQFQEGSQEIVSAKDTCVQNMADVKVEFETYVRELVSVPTVQEIKGGSTVVVARLDFGVLREAIESLNPDDRDSLLNKVSNAEKKVDVKAEPRKKTGAAAAPAPATK
ncbi:MAG: hypothetical protein IPJ65_33255 [Archangiaceae bacterium]|nr:hypothetical protein [Archangiaceae bacterium]